MSDERPQGLEEVKSEPKMQKEEKHSQLESGQEAQEEEMEKSAGRARRSESSGGAKKISGR